MKNILNLLEPSLLLFRAHGSSARPVLIVSIGF
jgi:hypothetical protein